MATVSGAITLANLTPEQLNTIFEFKDNRLANRLVIEGGNLVLKERKAYRWHEKVRQWWYEPEGRSYKIRDKIVEMYKHELTTAPQEGERDQQLLITELFLDLFDLHMIAKSNQRRWRFFPRFCFLDISRQKLSSSFSSFIIEKGKENIPKFKELHAKIEHLAMPLASTSISKVAIEKILAHAKDLEELLEMRRAEEKLKSYLSFSFTVKELLQGVFPLSPNPTDENAKIIENIATEFSEKLLKKAQTIVDLFSNTKVSSRTYLQNSFLQPALQKVKDFETITQENINKVFAEIEKYIFALWDYSDLGRKKNITLTDEKQVWELVFLASRTQKSLSLYSSTKDLRIPVDAFYAKAKELHPRYVFTCFEAHIEGMKRTIGQIKDFTMEAFRSNRISEYPHREALEVYLTYASEKEKRQIELLQRRQTELLFINFLQRCLSSEEIREKTLGTILEIHIGLRAEDKAIREFISKNNGTLLEYFKRVFFHDLSKLDGALCEQELSEEACEAVLTLAGQFHVWKTICRTIYNINSENRVDSKIISCIREIEKKIEPILMLAYLLSLEYLSKNEQEKEEYDRLNKDRQLIFKNVNTIKSGCLTSPLYLSLDYETIRLFGDQVENWKIIKKWRDYIQQHSHELNASYLLFMKDHLLTHDTIIGRIILMCNGVQTQDFCSYFCKWESLIEFIQIFEMNLRWLNIEDFNLIFSEITRSINKLLSLCDTPSPLILDEKSVNRKERILLIIKDYISYLEVAKNRAQKQTSCHQLKQIKSEMEKIASGLKNNLTNGKNKVGPDVSLKQGDQNSGLTSIFKGLIGLYITNTSAVVYGLKNDKGQLDFSYYLRKWKDMIKITKLFEENSVNMDEKVFLQIISDLEASLFIFSQMGENTIQITKQNLEKVVGMTKGIQLYKENLTLKYSNLGGNTRLKAFESLLNKIESMIQGLPKRIALINKTAALSMHQQVLIVRQGVSMMTDSL